MRMPSPETWPSRRFEQDSASTDGRSQTNRLATSTHALGIGLSLFTGWASVMFSQFSADIASFQWSFVSGV